MFCRGCGENIPVDSVFCPNCGKNLLEVNRDILPGPEPTPVVPPSSPRRRFHIVRAPSGGAWQRYRQISATLTHEGPGRFMLVIRRVSGVPADRILFGAGLVFAAIGFLVGASGLNGLNWLGLGAVLELAALYLVFSHDRSGVNDSEPKEMNH